MFSLSLKKGAILALDWTLDISFGLIAAALVANIADIGLSWGLLLVGVVGAYAPDGDSLLHFRKKSARRDLTQLYKHRAGFHYPLLFLPIAGVVAWAAALAVGTPNASAVALSFALGSFFHFVHDTFLHGWGISWAYPFRDERLALFAHSRHERGLPAIKLIAPNNLEAVRDKHYDPEWCRFWQRPAHWWWYAFVAIHAAGIAISVSTYNNTGSPW